MKKLIIFFFSISLFAQDYGNNAETLRLCTSIQTNSFSSNLDADSALDRILEVVGLSKNFVLAPCSDINNAVAVSFKGVRYILYDPEFMSMLSSDTSNWTNLFILAHEVGHHVNGHSLDLVLYAGEIVDAPELKKKREQELEADEFAGFILAKLGASLNQTISSVSNLSNEDDTYSTHPKRDKRISAINNGFIKGLKKNGDNFNYSQNSIFIPRQNISSSINSWETKTTFPSDEIISNLDEPKRYELFNDPFKLDDFKASYPVKVKLSELKGQSINQNASKNLFISINQTAKDVSEEIINKELLVKKLFSSIEGFEYGIRPYNLSIGLYNFLEIPKISSAIYKILKENYLYEKTPKVLGADAYIILEFEYKIDDKFEGTFYAVGDLGWDQNYDWNYELKKYEPNKYYSRIIKHSEKKFTGKIPIELNSSGHKIINRLTYNEDKEWNGLVLKQDNLKTIAPYLSIYFNPDEHHERTYGNDLKNRIDFINKLKKGSKLYIRFSSIIYNTKFNEENYKSNFTFMEVGFPEIESYTYSFDLKGSDDALYFKP